MTDEERAAWERANPKVCVRAWVHAHTSVAVVVWVVWQLWVVCVGLGGFGGRTVARAVFPRDA